MLVRNGVGLCARPMARAGQQRDQDAAYWCNVIPATAKARPCTSVQIGDCLLSSSPCAIRRRGASIVSPAHRSTAPQRQLDVDRPRLGVVLVEVALDDAQVAAVRPEEEVGDRRRSRGSGRAASRRRYCRPSAPSAISTCRGCAPPRPYRRRAPPPASRRRPGRSRASRRDRPSVGAGDGERCARAAAPSPRPAGGPTAGRCRAGKAAAVFCVTSHHCRLRASGLLRPGRSTGGGRSGSPRSRGRGRRPATSAPARRAG